LCTFYLLHFWSQHDSLKLTVWWAPTCYYSFMMPAIMLQDILIQVDNGKSNPISGTNMIAVRHEMCLISKIGTVLLHGVNEHFQFPQFLIYFNFIPYTLYIYIFCNVTYIFAYTLFWLNPTDWLIFFHMVSLLFGQQLRSVAPVAQIVQRQNGVKKVHFLQEPQLHNTRATLRTVFLIIWMSNQLIYAVSSICQCTEVHHSNSKFFLTQLQL
jgi:hypothetical protein